MATPAKSVQAKDVETLVAIYKGMAIPAWSIKQGNALCYKYPGEDVTQGEQELRAYLQLLEDTESTAIYTLCQYEDPPDGKITDKTPCDLSNNFRLNHQAITYGSPDHYGGAMGQVFGELKKLREEVSALKNREDDPPNKLGIIGDILENEALQPLVMGIAGKVADWLIPAKGVGELKRVSGVPGMPAATGTFNWREDAKIGMAMDSLAECVKDLPDLLQQLAGYAKHKPVQFALYKKMLMSTKF